MQFIVDLNFAWFLRYILPFIGHMGIATSTGIIRDFSGHYYVSEDNMAFGKPTKYWQLDYTKAKGGIQGWDIGIVEASEIYKTKMVKIISLKDRKFL